jgi:hypothetical protein
VAQHLRDVRGLHDASHRNASYANITFAWHSLVKPRASLRDLATLSGARSWSLRLQTELIPSMRCAGARRRERGCAWHMRQIHAPDAHVTSARAPAALTKRCYFVPLCTNPFSSHRERGLRFAWKSNKIAPCLLRVTEDTGAAEWSISYKLLQEMLKKGL